MPGRIIKHAIDRYINLWNIDIYRVCADIMKRESAGEGDDIPIRMRRCAIADVRDARSDRVC